MTFGGRKMMPFANLKNFGIESFFVVRRYCNYVGRHFLHVSPRKLNRFGRHLAYGWGLGYVEPDENVGYRFSENRTKLTTKFKNRKLSFRTSFFKKPTLAVWGQFFMSHSQFIFQHDRINSQSIFLRAVYLHF